MVITLRGVMDGVSGCILGVYVLRGVQMFGKGFIQTFPLLFPTLFK